ncbi:hypothetical protein JTB14_001676 [Gonioctena quinquepunctata]|nr:hypothetical protein JTB14_001676 [Gonioctena quinquepunctata]
MCQCKSKDKLKEVPNKLKMSGNNNEQYNNYPNRWCSMNSNPHNLQPSYSLIFGPNGSGQEESTYRYNPYSVGPVMNPWNPYFGNYYMNYYTPVPVLYPFPSFHYTADQTSIHGRYFHRPPVYIRQRNMNPGGNNGETIMALRTWEKININPSNKPSFIFTLMSYNVLAQDLLEQHPYLYRDHNTEYLMWETRWNNLIKEISKFSPDILCLQEVQESHLEEYYSLLEALGYKGIYKKRTGGQSDGCAIYYKADNVSLVQHTLVKYFQPTVSLLNRDNIGILAKFVPKLHPTREFVVATTHLLYNPRRNDVRMAQMQLLLTEIEKMSYRVVEEESSYLPVLITGDLNTPPRSDLYEFLTNGEIKYENLSPRMLEGDIDGIKEKVLVTSRLGITDNCQHANLLETRLKHALMFNEEKCCGESGNPDLIGDKKVASAKKYLSNNNKILSHNFFLKSVYDHGGPQMNEGTTYQDEWLTVDYIFYSMNKEKNKGAKLQLLSRYRLPTKEELGETKIPNRHLGSDHLSLIAKFKLEF